jgi:CheY-like chemotaxis protein
VRTALCFGVGALILAVSTGPAQEPKGKARDDKAPPPAPKPAEPGAGQGVTPQTMFEQIRSLINEGRLDRASALLQPFADAATPADFLAIEKKYGSTVFQQLRTVVRWSDNPDADRAAKTAVDAIVDNARKATEAELRNPQRVTKFVRNLGATFEERAFAEVELRRVGDYAVPYMVDALKTSPDEELVRGIIGAIPRLDASAMAPWLAALEILDGDKQFAVLNAIASRADAPFLLTTAQTDFAPYLWQVAGAENDQGQPLNPGLRAFALATLAKIHGGAIERRDPATELVSIARRYADHKGRFAGERTNPDGSPATVSLWTVTPDGKLTKLEAVPVGDAEEYFGLRYARMALGLRPADLQARSLRPAEIDAQRLILTIAAEKGMERAKFGELAKSAPAVYALLADAPSHLTIDLLDQALNQKRTALVLALTQVIGDRSEKAALEVRPIDPTKPLSASNVRPPLLVRALEYPDPRVQLAAALAILRSPGRLDPTYFPQVPARVVQVLRQAAAADLGIDPKAQGQALVVDPNKQRADTAANLLRALGYQAEVYTTGRDLLRRVTRTSDYDLILIDHHVPNPQLFDLVSQIRADVGAARRPILVVASAAQPKPPTLDSVLLQFAALIAAADTDPVNVPPPYVLSARLTEEEQEAVRNTNRAARDSIFRQLATTRLRRLRQAIDAAYLNLTPAQKFLVQLRAEQLTYAAIAIQYPMSADSAPATVRHMGELRRLIDEQAKMPEYVRGFGMTDLMARLERLEVEVKRDPIPRKRFEEIRPRLDPVVLGLVVGSTRDFVIEARLAKTLQNFVNVHVIPEPYSTVGFEGDVRAAFADPADVPRDPAEKRAAAKAAVDALRRIAVGETPGYDVRPAEPELRAALNQEDLADAAVEALGRIGTAEAQQALVGFAINQMKPVPVRSKAADAAARHVQAFGRLTPATLTTELTARSTAEANADLRGKLLVLRGLLAHNPANFSNELRRFNPPVLTAPPMGEAPPPAEKKDKKPD